MAIGGDLQTQQLLLRLSQRRLLLSLRTLTSVLTFLLECLLIDLIEIALNLSMKL